MERIEKWLARHSRQSMRSHKRYRPKNRETWWRNDKVAKVVDETRRLFRIWKNSKCEMDRAPYTRAKKIARAEVAKAQEAGRKDFGDMLDEAETRGQVY